MVCKTVSVFARISATNGSAQFSLRSNLVGGTGKHARGQCWPGEQSIHVLAENLTQEFPEAPERGHDMSAAGKSLWRPFWRNAVMLWLGFDPWLSSCAIRFARIVAAEASPAVADMASSPIRLHELSPTGLSRGRFFRLINAEERWGKSRSVRPVGPGRTRVWCVFVGSSSLRFVPSYIGTGTNPKIDD